MVNSSSSLAISCATLPKTRQFKKSYSRAGKNQGFLKFMVETCLFWQNSRSRRPKPTQVTHGNQCAKYCGSRSLHTRNPDHHQLSSRSITSITQPSLAPCKLIKVQVRK